MKSKGYSEAIRSLNIGQSHTFCDSETDKVNGASIMVICSILKKKLNRKYSVKRVENGYQVTRHE